MYHYDVSLFADSLEANGIRVWVDVTGLKAGVDFLSKIGKAIIDSKVIHKNDINIYTRLSTQWRGCVCIGLLLYYTL